MGKNSCDEHSIATGQDMQLHLVQADVVAPSLVVRHELSDAEQHRQAAAHIDEIGLA